MVYKPTYSWGAHPVGNYIIRWVNLVDSAHFRINVGKSYSWVRQESVDWF